MIDEKVTTRELSVAALSKFYETYYHDETSDILSTIIEAYIKTLKESTNHEHKSQGIVLMLGQLPQFMLKIALKEILSVISAKTIVPDSFAIGYNHSELRRDCIKSLVNISKTIGFEDSDESLSNANYMNLIFDCYMRALDEYAIDNRGDIGSWVREAGINALHNFLTTCPHQYMTPKHVNAAMVGIAKQAVERIDKIRAIAGKIFVSLIYQYVNFFLNFLLFDKNYYIFLVSPEYHLLSILINSRKYFPKIVHQFYGFFHITLSHFLFSY